MADQLKQHRITIAYKTRTDLGKVAAGLLKSKKAYWKALHNPVMLSEQAAVLLTEVETKFDQLQAALAYASIQLEQDEKDLLK